jgi:DNA mismatch repair ATPase MutS
MTDPIPNPEASDARKKALYQFQEAFRMLGKKLDDHEKSMGELTDAVTELTDVLMTFAEGAAKSAQYERPLEAFFDMLRQVMGKRR